jgi:hypothetical protein
MLAFLFALHAAFAGDDAPHVLQFGCKMTGDRGIFSSGVVTMTDSAIVVETKRVFSVETFGIEYNRVHADFRTIRRVFETEVRIGEWDGQPLSFLCSKSEGQRFTDAMKAKLLKGKRLEDIKVPPPEQKRTVTITVDQGS